MKVKDRAFGLKLIAAVKREPCLYAYFYGNRESSSVGSLTRKAAWQRVANELGMAVPDVKAKWNTMRDRYRTLRGKNQGQEWFYFQPMSFMEQYVKPGRNSMRQSLHQHPSAMDGAYSSEGSTSYALLAEGAQAEPLIDGMDIHAMLSAIDHSWTQGVIKAEMTDNVDTYDASSSGMERFVEGNNGALTASVDEDQS
ncbi:MADF domain containing protein, partial [Aphelenchoides avenae]